MIPSGLFAFADLYKPIIEGSKGEWLNQVLFNLSVSCGTAPPSLYGFPVGSF